MSTPKILSPNVNKEWAFTCGNCPYVPWRDGNPEEIAMLMQMDSYSSEWQGDINPFYPKRCRTCEANKKRNQRMKQRARTVWNLAEEIVKPTYHYPKLITFSLLTDEYYSNTWYKRDELLQELGDKLPGAIKKLMKNGMLGCTLVMECNSRLQPMDEGQPLWTWRHHPHVHAVAISPFIHHTKLKEWCEQLMPMGLGRINYKAPRHYKSTANYVGKYLSKQSLNVRTFGILRGYKLDLEQCRCKHEDFIVGQSYCDCY